MTRRFVLAILAIVVLAGVLRGLWLRSDPPIAGSVGIVWHDEGAWVHNARNRALWGAWRTDAWNPVFVAPVFTALEFGAFEMFGVGTWQARTVPVASGLMAVLALMAGLLAISSRRAALFGGVLLASNYGFVMWNRAALMESTMTALLVVSWAAYALSERRPVWGWIAGIAAVLAWFTKASAAFFIAALLLDVVLTLGLSFVSAKSGAPRRAALLTLAGVAASAVAIAAVFVVPHWTEYRFYNWQMSVTRKPSYTLRALVDRASWLPLVQDLFTRMWLVFTAAMVGVVAVATRWRSARPAERLLVFWLLIGLTELVVHDSGNVRRYVMFIPAIVGLAALVLSSRTPVLAADGATGWLRILLVPVVLSVSYLVAGSASRVFLARTIDAGHLSLAVRLSALAAIVIAGLVAMFWRRIVALGSRRPPSSALFCVCLAATIACDLYSYVAWAMHRHQTNYLASVALGQALPAGTLVQGKLANGLSLENRIRPVFIGNGFGNYDDRLQRDDVRYLLTYDLPRIGYESSDGSGLIDGILEHYPRRTTVRTFEVDETPEPDRAALIDKLPDVVDR